MSPNELQIHEVESYLSGMMAGLGYAQDLVEDHQNDPDSVIIVTEQDMRESFDEEEPERSYLFSDEVKEALIEKYIEGWRTGAKEAVIE